MKKEKERNGVTKSIPADILATKKLEIPKCLLTPVNHRIFVISVAMSDMKSPGGLILPFKMSIKKSDELADLKRYFVVKWDKEGIPPEIEKKLSVGIEIVSWVPMHAEEWDLPRVIDPNTGNEFLMVDYTEIAGISEVIPEEVE